MKDKFIDYLQLERNDCQSGFSGTFKKQSYTI